MPSLPLKAVRPKSETYGTIAVAVVPAAFLVAAARGGNIAGGLGGTHDIDAGIELSGRLRLTGTGKAVVLRRAELRSCVERSWTRFSCHLSR